MLEILAHVNKRIKALPSLQLPLHELVELYGSPHSGPMARNFALVYIENAAGRATTQARFAEVRRAGAGVWCEVWLKCPMHPAEVMRQREPKKRKLLDDAG